MDADFGLDLRDHAGLSSSSPFISHSHLLQIVLSADITTLDRRQSKTLILLTNVDGVDQNR